RPGLLGCVGGPVDFFGSGARMAIRAIETQRGTHDPHGSHDVVHGHALHEPAGLGSLVGCFLWWRRLSLESSARPPEQRDRRQSGKRDTQRGRLALTDGRYYGRARVPHALVRDASELRPTQGLAKTRVEMSLDPARKSACGTSRL